VKLTTRLHLVEVKNKRSYMSTPLLIFMKCAGTNFLYCREQNQVYLKKHKDLQTMTRHGDANNRVKYSPYLNYNPNFS